MHAWVQRTAFRDAYDGLADAAYVDALIGHTGVSFTQSERDALVSSLAAGRLSACEPCSGRIAENEQIPKRQAQRDVCDDGILRLPATRRGSGGFQFWLNKLNQFGGNFEQAEMVKAFINSGEYRQRFAQ